MICNIVTQYPTRAVICVEDFNTPEVRWLADIESAVLLPQCDRLTQRAMIMLEKCDLAGLVQNVDGPTRGENFLDLLFSKHATVETSVRNGTFESDHAEICATVTRVTFFHRRACSELSNLHRHGESASASQPPRPRATAGRRTPLPPPPGSPSGTLPTQHQARHTQ